MSKINWSDAQTDAINTKYLKNGKSCIKGQSNIYDMEVNPIKICGEFLDYDPLQY